MNVVEWKELAIGGNELSQQLSWDIDFDHSRTPSEREKYIVTKPGEIILLLQTRDLAVTYHRTQMKHGLSGRDVMW